MASTIMPRAPPPESGFMSAVGRAPTHCVSMPISEISHFISSTSQSMAPEARKTPMLTKMAMR